MVDVSEPERRIIDHLREGVRAGKRYFRARHIADAVGLTSKEVGVRLSDLDEKSDEVKIEKWGRSRSTTWRVTEA